MGKGLLDLFNPDAKEEEPKPDPSPKPLTITFQRGPSTIGQPGKVGSYGLTPLGRQKLTQLDANDMDYLILSSISDNGPSTIGMIADDVHITPPKVERRIKGPQGLLKGGCVKVVGMGGE